MAGVKGRSGGARPGAGRKKRLVPPAHPEGAHVAAEAKGGEAAAGADESEPMPGLAAADDPLDFLLAAMNNPLVSESQRIRAAIAAAQYKHQKKGEAGKKDGANEKAKSTAGGKFQPAGAPRLVHSR